MEIENTKREARAMKASEYIKEGIMFIVVAVLVIAAARFAVLPPM